MENGDLRQISRGNIRGYVRKEVIEDVLPLFIGDPFSSIQKMGGQIIKESKWRAAFILSLSGGRKIFLKRDRSKGGLEYLKYLFLPSKGKKEFFIASQLEKKNLPLPKPLGWIEKVQRGLIRESYFLSEAIEEGIPFIEEHSRSKDPHSIGLLATTVRRFQEAGLFHQDLHTGNFLWGGDSLLLIDLHRAKFKKSLSMDQRLWNLAHLFHSLREGWGEGEQLQFLNQYFEGEAEDSKNREILYQKIYPLMKHLQKRQFQSRTKRCLMESTDFAIRRERGICYFYRREFPIDRLKRLIDKHRTLLKEEPSSLIKCSPEVNVSLLEDDGERICLKQFCYPQFWRKVKEYFRRPKGIKAWVAANGIRVRGLSTLKPLAYMERRKGLGLEESFFVMEALAEGLEMDRYILKGFDRVERKRFFIKSFAQWLKSLHQKDLYHKDMKTCNILVSENEKGWNFHLLDFEDILLDRKINSKKIFKNFLQLNTSTPKVMSSRDRFRFFKEYLQHNPLIRDRKIFLKKLILESQQMGLVYVSDQGVVMESL